MRQSTRSHRAPRQAVPRAGARKPSHRLRASWTGHLTPAPLASPTSRLRRRDGRRAPSWSRRRRAALCRVLGCRGFLPRASQWGPDHSREGVFRLTARRALPVSYASILPRKAKSQYSRSHDRFPVSHGRFPTSHGSTTRPPEFTAQDSGGTTDVRPPLLGRAAGALDAMLAAIAASLSLRSALVTGGGD